MQEDLKLLEWVIVNQLYIDTHNECDYHNIHKAIENLIKRNKELEEISKEQANKIEDYEDYMRVSMIPKSKVREKIEKLNQEEIELQDSISLEEREEYSDVMISWQLCDIDDRRKILEELLQEGDDK